MSSRASVSLEVRGGVGRSVSPAVRRELVRQLGRALQAAGADGAVALSLTDDGELHALNLTYAGEDHATDVLSFSQREGLPMAGAERGQRGKKAEKGPLGDVVISVPTAKRQAEAGGRSLLDELVHLAVHGLAHLLGYDHATPAEERVMFGYETRLREQARGRAAIARVPRPRKPRASWSPE